MIERKFISQQIKHFEIQDYIESKLGKSGYSHIDIKRTPLGEKVIVYTLKPGMVVGKKGENIKELTQTLKDKFGMENPQIEVAEVDQPFFDADLIARRIVDSLERFGPERFKSLGYKVLEEVMSAGALGAELVMSGSGIPSSRAKSWRFYAGYLKKSGDVSESQVKRSIAVAHLKKAAIGVKVSILPPDVQLPDRIVFRDLDVKVEVLKEEPKQENIPKIKEEKSEKESIVKTEQPKEEKKETKKKEAKPRKPRKSKIEQPKEEKKEENGDNKKE